MLQSAPNSNIYCYEPVIDTYQRLVKAKLGPRAHLFNVGLSSEAGEASINWCPSNPYLSSMYPSTAHSEASDIRVVPITLATGAGEMQRLGLDRIDVLKIDAEGHDLAALRGFSKALQDQRITVVQFEYNWFTLIAGTCLREFFDVLDGYLLCRLLPYGLEAFGYHPDLDDFKQSNWVAISAAVLESGDWRRFHVRPGAGLGGMALERSTVGKRFLDLYG
jgi:FkbM family methyltransferase